MTSNRPGPSGRAKKGQGSNKTTGPKPKVEGASKPSAATVKRSAPRTRYADRQAQKAALRDEARRRRNQRYALFAIALVVVIVGVLVIVKVSGGGTGGNTNADQDSPPAGTPVPAATLAKLRSVPLSTLDSAPTSGIATQVQSVQNAPLTADGKPQLLFIGAEFCPHCAAERWAMYVALSKFGTFSPEPGRIHSAIADGDVPTLTFYGTTFSSPYFTFTPVEVYTNHPSGDSYVTLQTPTQAEQKLWTAANGGGFPFLDFGGKAILPSAQYIFTPLEGLPFSDVASQVGNNSTQIGADIDASAGILVKTICSSLTQHMPASVCSP
jgi:Domain of unknown function (DUF929)